MELVKEYLKISKQCTTCNPSYGIYTLACMCESQQHPGAEIYKQHIREMSEEQEKGIAPFSRTDCMCVGSLYYCEGSCEIDTEKKINEEAEKYYANFEKTSYQPHVGDATNLMCLKAPQYVWLNLSYDIYPWELTKVPHQISKYFNGSQERERYDMGGDATFIMLYFPKTEFHSYEMVVKHLEDAYFYYLRKNLEIKYMYERHYNIFKLDYKADSQVEILVDVEDIYDVHMTKYCGFVNAMKEKSTDKWDFLPERVGYNGKCQVRLRCILEDDGNATVLLLETDNGYIFWQGDTS